MRTLFGAGDPIEDTLHENGWAMFHISDNGNMLRIHSECTNPKEINAFAARMAPGMGCGMTDAHRNNRIRNKFYYREVLGEMNVDLFNTLGIQMEWISPIRRVVVAGQAYGC